tara:strand:+ start:9529 stop:9939 length:411 start_codon:yes stop_codon:yes gene_type:complete
MLEKKYEIGKEIAFNAKIEDYLTERSHVFALAMKRYFGSKAEIVALEYDYMTESSRTFLAHCFVELNDEKVDALGLLPVERLKSYCEKSGHYFENRMTESELSKRIESDILWEKPKDLEIYLLMEHIRKHIDNYKH